ncbi:MAG: hypothetical protein ABW216_15175 [Candidatus Rokuibacteriota bacterium]|jgi:hypothetical protein
MKQNKDAGRGGRRMKDLKGKKLSVTQQEAVKGGITDGTSNTIMFAEVVKLPAVQERRFANKAVSP